MTSECKKCYGPVERVLDQSGHLYTPSTCGLCRQSDVAPVTVAKRCDRCQRLNTLRAAVGRGDDPARLLRQLESNPWRCQWCAAEHDEGTIMMPWGLGNA
jgi:hypothetical protein